MNRSFEMKLFNFHLNSKMNTNSRDNFVSDLSSTSIFLKKIVTSTTFLEKVLSWFYGNLASFHKCITKSEISFERILNSTLDSIL